MNEANGRSLYGEFPSLFSRAPFFECGDGWVALLRELFGTLVEIMAAAPSMTLEITEIKEKFSTVRVYYFLWPKDLEKGPGDVDQAELSQRVDAAIRIAEVASSGICELCGTRGRLRNDHGLALTRCDGCLTA